MHTLFLGNLPPRVTETSLRDLFRGMGVDVISIELRRGGIAFAHCPDQNSADRAIEVLNGHQISGVPIRVEPSVPRHNRSTKVFIRQMPADVDWDAFDNLVADFGEVISCERAGAEDSPTAIVTYKTSEQADAAAENLNKREFQGRALKATIYHERSRNPRRNGPSPGSGGVGRGEGGYSQELPLRMVVNARFIGAIIGQGGANIRQVTKESNARCVVDVNRGVRDTSGTTEKVISIFGTVENCSKACTKILEIVQRESAKDAPPEEGNNNETELKIRAHNNLVGRLIGKAGSVIKKIMEETGCTIFVSNITELSAFNMERTITVRGALENIAQAEQKISLKLRQCWESDVANAPGPMYGGPHPLLSHPLTDPYGGFPNFQHGGIIPGAAAPFRTVPGAMATTPIHGGAPPGPAAVMPQSGPTGGFTEIVHVWVPNYIVGALIGTKGVHIRNVSRQTGAVIHIESPPKGENGAESDEGDPQGHGPSGRRDTDVERRVTITGTDQQQYKAQFWVFKRICEQGFHFFDEVRLCTEVQVPSELVGRIIGKGGQNVRELQRMTGAQIKIPDDAGNEEVESVFVQIIGNFNASQTVQARIRQLVQQFHNPRRGRSVSSDGQNKRADYNHHATNHCADDQE